MTQSFLHAENFFAVRCVSGHTEYHSKITDFLLSLYEMHTYTHTYMCTCTCTCVCVCAMCSGVGSYFNQRTEYLKLTSTNNDRDATLQREGVKTPKQGLPGKGKDKQTPNLNTSWVGSLLSFLIQCRSKISLGCKGKTGLQRELGFIASCNR